MRYRIYMWSCFQVRWEKFLSNLETTWKSKWSIEKMRVQVIRVKLFIACVVHDCCKRVNGNKQTPSSLFCFSTDKQTLPGGIELKDFSPVVVVQQPGSRPWRTSPKTLERSSIKGWWWWPELGLARLVASQISGKKVKCDFLSKYCIISINILRTSGVFWGLCPHRSPGSGLYDNLQQYDLPYAEAIFEIGFFHRNPNPFFALAKELYPGNYQPNLTHYFVRLLHEKGQLLRMYTQNIDGLERRAFLYFWNYYTSLRLYSHFKFVCLYQVAGIPPEFLVEAHGTFATATCTVCLRKYEGEDLRVSYNPDTQLCTFSQLTDFY